MSSGLLREGFEGPVSPSRLRLQSREVRTYVPETYENRGRRRRRLSSRREQVCRVVPNSGNPDQLPGNFCLSLINFKKEMTGQIVVHLLLRQTLLSVVRVQDVTQNTVLSSVVRPFANVHSKDTVVYAKIEWLLSANTSLDKNPSDKERVTSRTECTSFCTKKVRSIKGSNTENEKTVTEVNDSHKKMKGC